MEKTLIIKQDGQLDFLLERLQAILEEKQIAKFIIDNSRKLAQSEIERHGEE